MAYLLEVRDPRPNKGDQILSEQVEMIFADKIPYTLHEDNVNAFLVSLREDINHVASIRSVRTVLESVIAGEITAITTIHYLLIGTTDLPYIP